MEIDKAALYRGGEYYITDHISIHVPTLNEIVDYRKDIFRPNGQIPEEEFYNMASSIVAEPVDLKWQLWDAKIDWTKVDKFDLFCDLLAPTLHAEETAILFGDVLDFSKMQKVYNPETETYRLVQNVVEFEDDIGQDEEQKKPRRTLFKKKQEDDTPDVKPIKTNEYQIVVDRVVYLIIVEVIRTIFGFVRRTDNPANEITKITQIEDAKEEYMMHKDDPYESSLFNYISAMVNSAGFKHDEVSVYDMNIYAFMDSVKRISKIKNSQLLLQSGYSGFGINLKDINKKELDWTGDL